MSCGLGAVILMFLLVKKNSQEEVTETSMPQNNLEIELLMVIFLFKITG